MLKKTLLALSLSLGLLFAYGQSTELSIEQLKAQVKKAANTDGRSKALALALLGYDFLAPENQEIQRLLYETYYATSEFDMYEDEYIENTFNSADWSPDGKQLAAAMSDGSIRLYSTTQWNQYETIALEANDGTLAIDWSPDGSQIVFGSTSGRLGIINVASKQVTREWAHGDYIRAVAWSPNGDKVAAGGDENIVYVYNAASGEKERNFVSHTDWIRAVSWSADGNMVAAASDDATATVWSVKDGNLVKTHSAHEDYCRDVAFAPSGSALATCSDDLNVYLYDPAADNIPDRNFKGHENWVMSLDWSPNGKMLATADNGGTIIVHTVRSGDQTFFNSVEPETGWMDIDFSPDGNKLAVTSAYELAVYQLGESGPVSRLTPEGVGAQPTEQDGNALEKLLSEVLPTAYQLYPSPNGERMGIIDGDYSLQVVNMSTGAVEYVISDHSDWIRNIAWSKDGELLATGSDDQMVGIWNAKTGEMQHFLSGHTDWVRDVDFSPDGKVLASAGDDGVLRFWDPSTGDELGSTDKIESYLMTVAWSPGQKYLAAQSSEDFLYIWNAANNDLLFSSGEATLQGSMNWATDQELMIQHQDGSLLKWTPTNGLQEAGSESGLVLDNKAGTKAKVSGAYISLSGTHNALLEGHEAQVIKLEWSPDGSYLISQGADGNMGIWDVKKNQPLALLPLTDGSAKALVWSTDGDGFYLPGAPGKVILNPSDLRATLSADQYDVYFSEADILKYKLEKILLNDSGVVAKIKSGGGPNLLNAIAAYYETRAAVQLNLSNKASDEEKAAAFRAAAGN